MRFLLLLILVAFSYGAQSYTDRNAFLRAIRALPEDDTVRLAYADWLDEHGEPERAEFIRLQIEIKKPDTPSNRLPKIERRNALLAAHEARWLPPNFRRFLEARGGKYFWDRGFVTAQLSLYSFRHENVRTPLNQLENVDKLILDIDTVSRQAAATGRFDRALENLRRFKLLNELRSMEIKGEISPPHFSRLLGALPRLRILKLEIYERMVRDYRTEFRFSPDFLPTLGKHGERLESLELDFPRSAYVPSLVSLSDETQFPALHTLSLNYGASEVGCSLLKSLGGAIRRQVPLRSLRIDDIWMARSDQIECLVSAPFFGSLWALEFTVLSDDMDLLLLKRIVARSHSLRQLETGRARPRQLGEGAILEAQMEANRREGSCLSALID